MEVVDGFPEGVDILEEVEGGGGGFTISVEEGEGGSTGRKTMPVGFFFFLKTAFESSKSSSSESDSDGFRIIFVGRGGTNLSDKIQKD